MSVPSLYKRNSPSMCTRKVSFISGVRLILNRPQRDHSVKVLSMLIFSQSLFYFICLPMSLLELRKLYMTFALFAIALILPQRGLSVTGSHVLCGAKHMQTSDAEVALRCGRAYLTTCPVRHTVIATRLCCISR